MSNFWGRFFQLFVGKFFFWKHCSVRTEKLHRKKVKNQFFLGLKMPQFVHRGREQTSVLLSVSRTLTRNTMYVVLQKLQNWGQSHSEIVFNIIWSKGDDKNLFRRYQSFLTVRVALTVLGIAFHVLTFSQSSFMSFLGGSQKLLFMSRRFLNLVSSKTFPFLSQGVHKISTAIF